MVHVWTAEKKIENFPPFFQKQQNFLKFILSTIFPKTAEKYFFVLFTPAPSYLLNKLSRIKWKDIWMKKNVALRCL